MLAEAYEHWKEEFPTHGIEIIFDSSDRDQSSFNQYYGSMPWMALPFSAPQKKQEISMRYGVGSIPSFVILDAMLCEIVSTADQSGGECCTAWRRKNGTIAANLVESYSKRKQGESRVILSAACMFLAWVHSNVPVLLLPGAYEYAGAFMWR